MLVVGFSTGHEFLYPGVNRTTDIRQLSVKIVCFHDGKFLFLVDLVRASWPLFKKKMAVLFEIRSQIPSLMWLDTYSNNLSLFVREKKKKLKSTYLLKLPQRIRSQPASGCDLILWGLKLPQRIRSQPDAGCDQVRRLKLLPAAAVDNLQDQLNTFFLYILVI